MIGIKEVLLLAFAVVWIVFFLSPFAIYSRSTRAPMTRTERAIMIAVGLALVLTLWYALPHS